MYKLRIKLFRGYVVVIEKKGFDISCYSFGRRQGKFGVVLIMLVTTGDGWPGGEGRRWFLDKDGGGLCTSCNSHRYSCTIRRIEVLNGVVEFRLCYSPYQSRCNLFDRTICYHWSREKEHGSSNVT